MYNGTIDTVTSAFSMRRKARKTGKCLGHIILLAIKVAGNFSQGMTTHPTKHRLTEELLHRFPGKGITLLQSATEKFHAVLLITQLTASVVV